MSQWQVKSKERKGAFQPDSMTRHGKDICQISVSHRGASENVTMGVGWQASIRGLCVSLSLSPEPQPVLICTSDATFESQPNHETADDHPAVGSSNIVSRTGSAPAIACCVHYKLRTRHRTVGNRVRLRAKCVLPVQFNGG